MFSKEYRPLRRPRLGVPDYYPQDSKQKEDELSHKNLNNGFRSEPVIPITEEFSGALKDFNQHFLNTKEYCLKVNQVEDERKRRRWVQDSEKKKLQVSKENFFPVPLGRNRKEIATQWFQELASSKPLSQLVKKVPIFNKKEEIFDNLCEKDVPISRAAWYIKMTSAYNVIMSDSKAKKKQSADPSFDWTLSLTRYMQESMWSICNESQVMGRHESHGGSRTPSVSGHQSPSEEMLMEITHWQYMLHLSSWLYEENLLDKHEFIRWLIDRIEHVKSSDTKALQLHLPLVLRHLLDIANCVSLARPLVTYCCERLAALFEMEQRLHKLQVVTPKQEPLERVVETNEDDSVFNEIHVKQEPGRPTTKETKSKRKSSSYEKKEESVAAPIINTPNEDTYFHWCSHHQAVMLELVCIIQTIAMRCPTAFVQVKVTSGRGSLGREAEKGVSPLVQLPYSLTELPMPTSLNSDLRKKLLTGLVAAEQEIAQRNKAAESRWSSMTVADLQTTSEGSNVRQILKLLEVLDKHSFHSCRAHNPLTTLYCRIAEVQRSNEVPLSDEMLAMLLCQWAVTCHRAGSHRPLVVAQILRQRQSEIIKGESWKESYDKDNLDDCWEGDTVVDRFCDIPYPLQQTLVKFLDTRAPLSDDLSVPMRATDPFFKLIVLFAELIRLDVFSYRTFLSTLIARGETRPPIIPSLPFARDGESGKSRKRQDSEPLNLSIPLPVLKKARFEHPEVSIASGPPSPVSSSNFSGLGGFTSALDSFITGSPVPFQQGPGMDDSTDILEDRALKLRMLASEHDSSQLSQLMSPLAGFNSLATDTDVPNSPIVQSKSDPFNFSLSLLTEEDQMLDLPLNKHASRHLLFAAYFPIADSQLTQQSLNERSVVLCGVGKSRNKVESIIKKVTVDVEHYYRLLETLPTPVLPDQKRLQSVITSYQSLPTFEQNVLATSCEKILRRSLSPSSSGKTSLFPACAQLVFVCELLKVCGSISQIVQLLVDIIACDASLVDDEESGEFKGQHRGLAPPPLPKELCLPVIGLLQRCLTCLLLSQQDTTIVFEGLYRVLEGPAMSLSTHKSVFLFLHKLYTKCSFLQKTFRPTFGNYCVRFGERFGLSIDRYPPTATDAEWQRTAIVQQLAKPSNCDIASLCSMIKNGVPPYPKPYFTFVVDIFSAACQKNINCETLSHLAYICAEVCSDRGSQVNMELLGAFRALCIPSMSTMKTGFSALTNKSNILMDFGIHSNLLTFVCLLISHNIFHLQDVIVYVISAIIYVQLMNSSPGASPHSYLSLEFATSLILHLLVPDYSDRQHSTELSQPVKLPPFVQDSLQAKCMDLNLGYVILLLKNLLKISHTNVSRERTKTASLLVHSSSSGNETTLSRVRATLETVASQDWVRDKCSLQGSRLLDSDMLGDTSLTPSQARYLLHLLCPYSPSSVPSDSNRLAKMEPHPALEHILKNLDQWTLRNALLHIDVHVHQATARTALQDHLASEVIHVFEDSCGDEWLGQTIECSVESGDGSYSPRVWLVTPLISQLAQSVLGRVLKSAGNVLGQGQWWNPEKSQEKRRSTRATSGVAPPKTGLQWQQPFLELVLACMHAQTNTHEELLGPLKSQLSTFISAYDREGTPADEQSKTMLYAAIKLRLSLVGSMLSSICSSEPVTLEWVPLLMQLICSGAVDRQTDTSELFTNSLDMLCTLLRSLPNEFQTCMATGGEEGKKAHISCVKKLKSELNGAKSYCASEIQQLFPLSQELYTVTIVKQPSSLSLRNSLNTYTERIKGLRVQDTRDISPWDILEGVKNSGPLTLAWFGGVRMKRKPLRFEEQRWLLRFHTHQEQFKDMMYRPNYVKLPESIVPEVDDSIKVPEDGQTPMIEAGKALAVEGVKGGGTTDGMKSVNSAGQLPPGANQPMPTQPGMQQAANNMQMPNQTPFARPGMSQMPRPMMSGDATMMANQQPNMVRPGMYPGQATAMRPGMQFNNGQVVNSQRRNILEKIRSNALRIPGNQFQAPPPMYQQRPMQVPGSMGGYTNPAAAQRMIQVERYRQHHQRRVMQLRMQQQQAMQQQSQMAGVAQYNQFHPSMQQQIQPMQANPPVPMHQVMRQTPQTYRQPMMPQGNMMVHPAGNPAQQTMQYPQQHPTGMNTMHRPGMF